MVAGERDLRRADEVQVVVGEPVHLGRVRAEEAGALHDLRRDQGGRDDRREAGGVRLRHREIDQREFELGADAGEEVEPRAGDLRAALGVDRAQRGADARCGRAGCRLTAACRPSPA